MAMEWSNEQALEFLELLQLEPCLWNPKLQSHKNRSAGIEAWRRIIESLSFETTLEEVKKKKASLMGYYRVHLNKYKKSIKSATGKNDIYTTNWFAFELMNSFLKPIYLTETTPENKTIKCKKETPKETSQTAEEDPVDARNLEPSTSVGINRRNIETLKRRRVQTQTSNSPPEIIHATDTFECLESITRRNKEQLDEYDHFAFMVAAKIRKLQNSNDREILMNSIQNMVFEFCVQNKQNTQSDSPTVKSPVSVESST